MPKINYFLRPFFFFDFWRDLGHEGFEGLGTFLLNKSICFSLFFKLAIFIDFATFWEGFGRVLGGFWMDFGRIGGGVGEGLGRLHDQNEVGPADCAQRLNLT